MHALAPAKPAAASLRTWPATFGPAVVWRATLLPAVTANGPGAERAASIRRPRLDDVAERLLHASAALIVGSGGYGKSTVLAAWRDALAGRARTAWLALEARDASLSALAERVYDALRAVVPELGDSSARLLESGVGDAASVARALVNELFVSGAEFAEPLVLFIDDVHLVLDDEPSVAFVAGLLQALPPYVHLALASRRAFAFAPVSKLRAGGRLIELDETALKFTVAEAVALVGGGPRAADIVSRTDGWAIAVRLAATLAGERGTDIDAVLPAVRERTFDFLAQEVVAQMPSDVRDTAYALALPPTFDESIAAYLMDSTEAARAIERLTSGGAYVQRVAGGWQFHQLFRDFLLAQFRIEQPERERSLRRQYAHVLRHRGEKLEALKQLVEAGDFLEIVEYVHEAVLAIRYTDRLRPVLDLLSQVPDAVKNQKPMLYRLQALALQRSGRLEAANEQFNACYAAARASGDARTACMALVELGIAAGNFRYQGHGEFFKSERYFADALALAESAGFAGGPGYRRVAHYFYGMSLAARCAYAEAFEHLAIAERLELAEETHSDPIFIGIAVAHAWTGDWRKSLEYAELAEELFRGGADFHLGYAYLMQARALFTLRDDVPRATALADEALVRLADVHAEDERVEAGIVRVRCALALEPPDLETATALTSRMRASLGQCNPLTRAQLHLLRADLALAAGDPERAEIALDDAEMLAVALADPGLSAAALRARATVARARNDSEHATLLRRALAAFETLGDAYGVALVRLEAFALQARDGVLDAAEVEAFLAQLETRHHGYVLAAEPASARAVLGACLRDGVACALAARLFPNPGDAAAELAALALDAHAASEGRAAALRLLRTYAPLRADAVVATLYDDGDAVVASTARALAPSGRAVPPLGLDVIATVRVRVGAAVFDETDARWARKKAPELLRYLALANAPVSRTAAIGALWPEGGSGSEVTLRVTLLALRRALQPGVDGPGDYVVSDAGTLGLRRECFVASDANRALSELQRGKYAAARGRNDEAKALLASAALALSAAPKERSVPTWLQPHVARWRIAAVDAQTALASLFAAEGNRLEAIAWAERALALDGLNEDCVATLLELYADGGAYDEARALFGGYKRRLADSFGASPSPRLVERFSTIVARRAFGERRGLSERERDVLRSIALGRSNKEIASELDLSVFTVNNHVARILRKLQVENRAAAASIAAGILGGQ